MRVHGRGTKLFSRCFCMELQLQEMAISEGALFLHALYFLRHYVTKTELKYRSLCCNLIEKKVLSYLVKRQGHKASIYLAITSSWVNHLPIKVYLKFMIFLICKTFLRQNLYFFFSIVGFFLIRRVVWPSQNETL